MKKMSETNHQKSFTIISNNNNNNNNEEKMKSNAPTTTNNNMTSSLELYRTLSQRIRDTDMPMINKIGGIISEVNQSLQQSHAMKENTNPTASSNNNDDHNVVYSLCQGMVYFKPPEQALQTLLQDQLMNSCNPSGSEFRFIHNYCEHDFGRRVVRDKVKEKLQKINKLENVEVVLTSGANQGFVSVLLSLCDVGDSCLLFGPYYFNHFMALQMFGVKVRGLGCAIAIAYSLTHTCTHGLLISTHFVNCCHHVTLSLHNTIFTRLN